MDSTKNTKYNDRAYDIAPIIVIQWNLFIMDTLGPAISGSFFLLYRGFPLSEVKMY